MIGMKALGIVGFSMKHLIGNSLISIQISTNSHIPQKNNYRILENIFEP
jgi:hypothetical protein